MKRQIRRSVFETNSSSTHAICISKGDYNIINHIDFDVGDFGWECETYRSLYGKASYLIIAILDLDKETSDNYLNKLTDILDNNGIEYTLPKLKVVHTGMVKKQYIITILMAILTTQAKQKSF